MSEEILRDRLWMWGQDTGCWHKPHVASWNLPGVNRMGPMEAGREFDIPNCCRVVFDSSPRPPFDAASAELADYKRVIWSVVGDCGSSRNDDGGDDLEEVLRQADRFPNVVGGVLDDFFRAKSGDARIAPERLAEIARRLHAHPRNLQLWVVFYAALFGTGDYTPWLNLTDGITFWSWDSAELARADENLQRIIEMTPGKEHYAGCYIYNFGDCRPLTAQEMERQLELYTARMLNGTLDGIIICGSPAADLELEAVNVLRGWLRECGSLKMPKR
ncbi:MAG: hypothetical protein J6S21_04030 [Victivallales bacterium]|nr:hypothetical protein [Victivallales bacterium]